MDNRYSLPPLAEDARQTAELRDRYLISTLFAPERITLVYSHTDRIIVGSAVPRAPLTLGHCEELRTPYFSSRRETAVILVGGGDGTVKVGEGTEYRLSLYDCLYIGSGERGIVFSAVNPENPPLFYFNSAPAHRPCSDTLITLADAVHVTLGSSEECNRRTINKYVIPGRVESCQLTMGLTRLEPGSVWNTMPCHTHERRSEVYLYTAIEPGDVVFHFMGSADSTRHIVVRNNEAVISPEWSIHSGVGTKCYSFIWGMCGENQDFSDMDAIETTELR